MSLIHQWKFPAKIPTKVGEVAPTLFFPDVLSSKKFKYPIIPSPLRIDKLSNGYPIHYILPLENPIVELEERTKISFELKQFYSLGIRNLWEYGREKTKELTGYEIGIQNLTKSWTESRNYYIDVPTFQEDQQQILFFYLNAYKEYLTHSDQIKGLIDYCESIIDHINMRIEENKIMKLFKSQFETKPMYKYKHEKYFPDILRIDQTNLETQKIKKMTFVPILIYDDLLECFISNKEILLRNEGEVITFETILTQNIVTIRDNFPNTKTKFIKNLDLVSPIDSEPQPQPN